MNEDSIKETIKQCEYIKNNKLIDQKDKQSLKYLIDFVKQVLNLINEYRNENGLEDLTIDAKLQETAKIKAEDLVKNNYFSHTSPTLGTPFELMKSQGIRYKIAGENLAGNISSQKAVEAWINSKDHRENILEKKFHKTGIFVIESPVYGKIYVQLFMN